jgi:hypothetical protein
MSDVETIYQEIQSLKDLLKALPQPTASLLPITGLPNALGLTPERVAGIVRRELRHQARRQQVSRLLAWGIVVSLGAHFAPDLLSWAGEKLDEQLRAIGERIGAEAVRAAEAESGLPITLGGRARVRDQLRTHWFLGRFFKAGEPEVAAFSVERCLTTALGQIVTLTDPHGQRRTGQLHQRGKGFVLTDETGEPVLTFAPAQISGFQFSEAGLGLTTTEAFPRSRPPVGNGTPERIPA